MCVSVCSLPIELTLRHPHTLSSDRALSRRTTCISLCKLTLHDHLLSGSRPCSLQPFQCTTGHGIRRAGTAAVPSRLCCRCSGCMYYCSKLNFLVERAASAPNYVPIVKIFSPELWARRLYLSLGALYRRAANRKNAVQLGNLRQDLSRRVSSKEGGWEVSFFAKLF